MKSLDEITEATNQLGVRIAEIDERIKKAKNELEHELFRNQKLQFTERLNALRWVAE